MFNFAIPIRVAFDFATLRLEWRSELRPRDPGDVWGCNPEIRVMFNFATPIGVVFGFSTLIRVAFGFATLRLG